jgi:hypothetical protein
MTPREAAVDAPDDAVVFEPVALRTTLRTKACTRVMSMRM